jgi:hypothetical protein
MAMPATPEPDREASAYLAAARKLRHALTERDKVSVLTGSATTAPRTTCG